MNKIKILKINKEHHIRPSARLSERANTHRIPHSLPLHALCVLLITSLLFSFSLFPIQQIGSNENTKEAVAATVYKTIVYDKKYVITYTYKSKGTYGKGIYITNIQLDAKLEDEINRAKYDAAVLTKWVYYIPATIEGKPVVSAVVKEISSHIYNYSLKYATQLKNLDLKGGVVTGTHVETISDIKKAKKLARVKIVNISHFDKLDFSGLPIKKAYIRSNAELKSISFKNCKKLEEAWVESGLWIRPYQRRQKNLYTVVDFKGAKKIKKVVMVKDNKVKIKNLRKKCKKITKNKLFTF
jgi:hypothetical protein